jgi:hypothetical protein
MDMETITRLTKDLKTAARILTKQEARYLVDTYYQIQEYRKATANQCRIMDETEEPHEVLTWFLNNAESLESQIKAALNSYTDGDPIGRWCKSITGIGPVIAAGLLAYIDIEKCPTAGHIWSFAGLDPTKTWGKGEKRPWCAGLKVLCWKIGQSFVKVSNNDKDIYGHIYRERKAYEQANNDELAYADQAAGIIARKKIGHETEAYKAYSQGKLPPAHIEQRAERYATKIFLSHLHAVWYKHHYGEEPPKPFAVAILGHANIIDPPPFLG